MNSRLILDGSRIELHTALHIFTADRSQIEGLRKIQDQYGCRTRICLKDGGDSFNVSDSFTGNYELNEWLMGLPDLDQRDADQITQQIEEQNPLDVAEDERLNGLNQANAWTVGLNISIVIASIPVIFVNYEPLYIASFVLLAIFPLLGIIILHSYPLFFTIFKGKSDPRADLGFVIIWPGMGMAYSFITVNNPTHLINLSPVIFWFLLVLVCYIAALFRSVWENSFRWRMLIVLVIVGAMYSAGLINAADTLLDGSTPSLYSSKILKMYVTHHIRPAWADYNLVLAPWGPISYKDDVDVPMRVYRQAKVGDQICLELHPGFLHAPWYAVVSCPEELNAPIPQAQ